MPVAPRRLPFFEHIAELRRRLIIIMLTLFTVSMILYFNPFYEFILAFIFAPIIHLVPGGELTTLGPFDAFSFRFKVSLYAAIVLTSPVIIWQTLAFFLPALKPKERKFVIPTFFAAVALFGLGCVFVYTVIMKPAFEFLIGQGGSMVREIAEAHKYLNGIGLMMIGFGLAFEIPIIVFYSIGFGLIPYKKLRANWRFVYSGLAVIAAVATPDWSPVTMGLLGGSLVILYEGSLLLARFVFAKRIREQNELAAELE